MAIISLHDIPGSQFVQTIVPNLSVDSAADEDHPLFRAPFKCKATKVHLIAQSAVTGVQTNNRSLVVQFRGSAGTTSAAIGSATLASGTDLDVMDVVTIDITDQNMSAGDTLALANNKNGTGLQTPRILAITEYVGR